MELPSKKTVAIVEFNNMPPQARPIYYQITIDPKFVTDDKVFIRLGNNPGDEITGWQRVDSLSILHVLAEADESGNLQPAPMSI